MMLGDILMAVYTWGAVLSALTLAAGFVRNLFRQMLNPSPHRMYRSRL